jgi:hypothetical protein
VIRHLVSWRWKDGTDRAEVEAALDGFVRAQATAPGALAASWSRNRYYNDRGFTHVVVGDFLDEDAVERWVASDLHRDAVVVLRDHIGDFAVVDLDEPYDHRA